MRLPHLVLGWLVLSEAQLLEGREDGTRNGETATAPTWAPASPTEAQGAAVAVGANKGFETRQGGGTAFGSSQHQPLKRRRPRHNSRQQKPAPTRTPPAAALDTAAAAAGAAGAAGARREAEKGRRFLAEVEVSEEERDSIDGSLLVPSFCPVEPFEQYAALHRDIMDGKLEPRFLVFRPYLYCGMGNRFEGLRGVLALAMMTGRALLVDWYGGLNQSRSRTSHKYEDNFLEAHGVPWGTFPSAMEDHEHYDGETDSTEIWCQMPNAIGVTTPCDESRMTGDFLATADWDHIYAKDTKVVIVQAHNHNPMEFLRLNEKPAVVEALRGLDEDVGPSVHGTCGLRLLLKPRPEFKDRYCRERSDVLDGKVPSVALHIRTGDNADYHPEWYESLPQDMENFVQCAAGFDEGLALAAAESSSSEPDLDLFSTYKEGVDSVWLLGTDSSKAIDLLKEGNHTMERGGKVVFIEGDEFHRAHSGSKGGAASNNAGPLIDLALLSEAPLLVGSHGSTFSENTAELGGLPGPLRLFLATPFRHIVGKHEEYDKFDDYRQGCRDLVSRPSSRDELRFALKTRLEPWVDCEEETR